MRLSATLYFLAACALGVLLAWQQDRYTEKMIALHERLATLELVNQRNAALVADLNSRMDETLGGYEQALKLAAGSPRRR